MRPNIILELLLIFVLLAFASSKSVRKPSKQLPLDSPPPNPPDSPSISSVAPTVASITTTRPSTVAAVPTTPPRICTCTSNLCNCCRNFNVPLLGIRGPGCATLQYLQGDRMAISMTFGDRVLSTTTISGRSPQPVCMPLPGGVSRFCGRVYNIKRTGDAFQACLGLELRALSNLEASVRVSCFKFGPEGVKVQPAQPLPVVQEEGEDEDDDDDDFGLDVDDDDDEDDDDDDDDDDDIDFDDNVEDTPFAVFRDDFFDDLFDEGTSGNSRPSIRRASTTTTTTTKKPYRKIVRRPTHRKPINKIRKATTVTTSTTLIPITQKRTTINRRKASTTSRPIRTPQYTPRPTRRRTTTAKPTSTTITPVTELIAVVSTTKRTKTRRRPTTVRTTTEVSTSKPSTVTEQIMSTTREIPRISIVPIVDVVPITEKEPVPVNKVPEFTVSTLQEIMTPNSIKNDNIEQNIIPVNELITKANEQNKDFIITTTNEQNKDDTSFEQAQNAQNMMNLNTQNEEIVQNFIAQNMQAVIMEQNVMQTEATTILQNNYETTEQNVVEQTGNEAQEIETNMMEQTGVEQNEVQTDSPVVEQNELYTLEADKLEPNMINIATETAQNADEEQTMLVQSSQDGNTGLNVLTESKENTELEQNLPQTTEQLIITENNTQTDSTSSVLEEQTTTEVGKLTDFFNGEYIKIETIDPANEDKIEASSLPNDYDNFTIDENIDNEENSATEILL